MEKQDYKLLGGTNTALLTQLQSEVNPFEIKTLQEENTALKAKCQDLVAKCTENENNLKYYWNKSKKLKVMNISLEEKIKEREEMSKSWEEQSKTLKGLNKKLTESTEELEERNKKLALTNQVLIGRNAELVDEIRNLKVKDKPGFHQNDNWVAYQTSSEVHMEYLKEQLSQKTSNEWSFQSKISELNEVIANLQSGLTACQNVSKMQFELDCLKDQLKQKTSSEWSLQAKIAELNDIIQNLRDGLTHETLSVYSKDSRIGQLKREITEKDDKIRSVCEENGQLIAALIDTKEELKKEKDNGLMLQFPKLENENMLLKNNILELTKKVDMLTSENIQQQEKLHVLSETNHQLENKVKMLAKDNADIKERLDVKAGEEHKLDLKISILTGEKLQLEQELGVLTEYKQRFEDIFGNFRSKCKIDGNVASNALELFTFIASFISTRFSTLHQFTQQPRIYTGNLVPPIIVKMKNIDDDEDSDVNIDD